MKRVHQINLTLAVLILIAGAFVYWVMVPSQVREVPGFGFSPRIYPRSWLLILMGLAAGLLLESLMRAPLVEKPDDTAFSGAALKAIVPSLVLCVGYGLLLERAGFLATTMLVMMAFMLLYGERKYLTMGAIAVGVTLGTYLFWIKVLSLTLP